MTFRGVNLICSVKTAQRLILYRDCVTNLILTALRLSMVLLAIQTPLLIIHGAEDSSVPSFLADEVFVGLRRLGKRVVYARYAGEGHWQATWGYANQVDYLNRMIEWYDAHLKKAPTNSERPRAFEFPPESGVRLNSNIRR